MIDLAKRTDSVGISAKKGLDYKFRSLAKKNLLHVAEKAVREITAVHGNYWPEAYGGLGDVFEYDREGLDKDTDERIQVLIELLQPDSLEGRVRLLLTEMPWDYPCEQKMSYKEKEEKQKEAVIDFTTELLKAPDDLKKAVSLVCTYPDDGRTGQLRTTPLFGKVLAQQSDDPIKWLNTIIAEIKKTDTKKRDLDFLMNEGGDGLRVGLDLMGMDAHGQYEILNELTGSFLLNRQEPSNTIRSRLRLT